MKTHSKPIATTKALADLSEKLGREKLIGFDTEFVREKTYAPRLALLQIATREEAWLVDVLAFTPTDFKPLLEILVCPSILKILHSSLGDQEALAYAYGITAAPTLDTFEAASLLGYGESVSLRDLIHRLLGVTIGKSHSRTDWLSRPIGDEMKHYALQDVQFLVRIGERLLSDLERMERKNWALQLSAYYENLTLYQDPSEAISHRLAMTGKISAKSYGILKALIQWREQRAKFLDIPRRRIADDETLMDLANARPQNLEQLSKFRGLNSGEIQKSGKKILELIQSQANLEVEKLPPMPPIRRPTGAESRVIDLLGTYLRTLCEDLQIASRQLLTAKELKKIVLDKLYEPKQWVDSGLCHPQAAELIGEEIKAMLEGDRCLKLEGGRVKIFNIKGGG